MGEGLREAVVLSGISSSNHTMLGALLWGHCHGDGMYSQLLPACLTFVISNLVN